MSQLTGYDKFIQQALKYGFSLWGTPKTGAITSHYANDDGAVQKGYPKVPPRFTDNGDGTITDNATGLMWIKEPGACGGAFGSPGNPSDMTLEEGIANCLALNYAGHNDWRLPNVKELFTIINFENKQPSIDETFFPNTQVEYYWVTTIYQGDFTMAWTVGFWEGRVQPEDYDDDFYVRPVRLGVPKD